MAILLRLFIILLLTFPGFGQSDFYIKKRQSPKLKKLKWNRFYEIKTIKKLYVHKEIAGITDSSLKITQSVKTSDSVMRIITYRNPNANDTVYDRVWRTDTISLAYTDILYLKKFWFSDRTWLEPFGYFAWGGVLCIVFIPIAAIAYGPADALEVAAGVGTFLGGSLAVLFIGSRTTKYDMQKKWTFTGGSTR